MLEPVAPGEAQAFLEAAGLRFETDADELLGLYEGGRLVACGARAGGVLKMIAVDPEHGGGDPLGELVTGLLASGRRAGHDSLFLFTRPEHVQAFARLNFHLLATGASAALMEHGRGLEAWLEANAALRRPGRNGAVVINGNPFSNGHLHLVRTAAAQVDHLYAFIVREDRSVFPFEVRFRLAREATAGVPNVTVLDTSRYAVSAGTFPSYFLKRADDGARAQMELDLHLFAGRIAPAFGIQVRFAGSEPLCPATAAYNAAMAEILPAHGLRWVLVPRLEAAGGPISATRIRAAFGQGDFATLEALVPPPTLAFLRSPEARPLAAGIRAAAKEP